MTAEMGRLHKEAEELGDCRLGAGGLRAVIEVPCAH